MSYISKFFELVEKASFQHINSIFSILELYNWSINIPYSVIVWDFQRFQTFNKTALKISTAGCLDCCVNQPTKNAQNLNIFRKSKAYTWQTHPEFCTFSNGRIILYQLLMSMKLIIFYNMKIIFSKRCKFLSWASKLRINKIYSPQHASGGHNRCIWLASLLGPTYFKSQINHHLHPYTPKTM